MPVVTLQDSRGSARARILPEAGFNCFEFIAPVANRAVEVLDAVPDFDKGDQRPTASGIPVLFPFPNRIRQAKYSWDGKDYTLPTKPGRADAIHGFVVDRPWRVVETTPDSVTGVFQLSVDAPDRRPLWPADFLITLKYTLRGATLRADVVIENPDSVPLPWGFGTHPYFKTKFAPESDGEKCEIVVPCAEQWELIDALPTGTRKPVDERVDLREGAALEGRVLDDVLTGVTSRGGQIETAIRDPQAGIEVAQVTDDVFREWVVFTPPHRRSVCLEPYTCVTDAINLSQQGLDAGWRVLAPGGRFATWYELRVGLIYA